MVGGITRYSFWYEQRKPHLKRRDAAGAEQVGKACSWRRHQRAPGQEAGQVKACEAETEAVSA